MQYNITYIDPTESMIVSNNPSTYDYSVEGVIPLSAPSLRCGEFRGWYIDSGFTTRINQLDSNIASSITIYAYVQTTTQLQILGSSITEIYDLSSEPYLLMTNRISGGQNRSLLAMTPENYSNQVSGGVMYIKNNTGSITANMNAVRQEYYVDVGPFNEVGITVTNHSSAKYLIFHFTRGTDNYLDNIDLNITIVGPVIGSSATNVYTVSVGSSIIYTRTNNEWSSYLYINPEMEQVITQYTNEVLNIRNYAYEGTLSFSPSNQIVYGGRKVIDVGLPGLDLSGFSNDIVYKSIFIQFDTSVYDLPGANISVLNNKQGYLNLIGAQASKLEYDALGGYSTIKVTYDYIPAYENETLVGYTVDIPVKIMVVI